MEILGLWCSDIHLNHASNGTKRKFLKAISDSNCSIFITGDISDGFGLVDHLKQISKACKKTVYFVSGNHDFYHSDFNTIDYRLKYITGECPNLVYVPHQGIVQLNSDTCVIASESWYDGKISPCLNIVPFEMNDFGYIKDFKGKEKWEMIQILQNRASQGLTDLKDYCKIAIKKYKNIIIMSHPVPFGSMTLQGGSQTPFYIWYEGGMFMGDFASANPDNNFLWISGHTHDYVDRLYGDNFRCCSINAEYTIPKLNAAIMENLNIELITGAIIK